MNEQEIEVIDSLRQMGFAVVVIYPEVLGELNPSLVEDILWDRFSNITQGEMA